MQKTFLCLLACALDAAILLAQHPGDYQFQFQFENTLSEWVPAPDGTWYGAGWSVSYPGYPMGVPFVLKWDPRNDSLIWTREVPMPLSEAVSDVALLPATDGGVYIGAAFDGCDYSTPDGLARLSASGDILWVVQTPDDVRWSTKVWLVPYPGGHVLFQTDYYQIEYDADGHIKWTDPVPFKWNGIARRLNGGYLVYGDHKIATTNLFLSIIEKPFDDDILHALQLPSGNWLFLGTETVYRVAPDYSVLAKNAIAGLKPWSAIFEIGGDYWVAGAGKDGNALLQRLDTAMLDVLSAQDLGPNYRVKSLIYTPGDSLLWLSGDCNFHLNQRVFLKSAPKHAPAIVSDRSVALTNIRLSTTPVVYPDLCDPWWPITNFEILFDQVYVTVKNTGSLPVQKFRINGNFTRCSYICEGYEQISEEISLSLSPGDSAEFLFFNDFDLNGQNNTNTVNLCFWTAMPDERLDANPDDDRFCQSFSTIVADSEPTTGVARIRTFPNPASSEVAFSIEMPNPLADPGTVILVNTAGQVVLAREFSGSTFLLHRGTLPAGIYFYEIWGQQMRFGTGKVVFTE